ncbi:hypothetical protein [Winogradskyella endarachnes]|uniref:Uncharacterized protein n=1 Tax=Winogradskyella endarachnes TaxID=2681965 RepID=A0A6L6UC08_9FLAO|nr:hypothetical protein [Winogradskyella endarachnes]MUU79875.1 hypothetical protein [Winogradskyella endarachnes]
MTIDSNSHFRFPPKKLKPEQVIVFNAITYSVDICEITYDRLYNELIKFSENPSSTNENYPKIFADVWTIISNATIFMNLITRHFDLGTEEPMLSELSKAKKLRNSYQHIDERISEVLTLNDLPMYGSLSWMRNIPNSNKFQQFMLYSGVFTNHTQSVGGQMISPTMEIGIDEIDEIIFESITKQGRNFPKVTISIKKLISDIRSWIEHFEKQINEQLDSHGKMERHNTNLFFQIDGHRE